MSDDELHNRQLGRQPSPATEGSPASSLSRATCRALFDVVPIGAIAFDSDFRLDHANALAHSVLGFDPTERSVEVALRGSRVQEPDLLIEALRDAGETVARPTYHLVEDESGALRCVAVDVNRLADGEFTVAWFRDVTDARQVDQLRLLAEIGRGRFEQPTVRDFAVDLVEKIVEFLNFDIAVVTLLQRDKLRPLVARGLLLEPDLVIHLEDNAYVAKAIETGAPLASDGSEWESGQLAEMTGHHYVVPLLASGQAIGCLHLGALGTTKGYSLAERTAEGRAHESLDEMFLTVLSRYAGAALANARLFEQVREERAKLTTVVEAIPHGIVVYNSSGEVLISNAEAREIAGFNWSNLNTDHRPYLVRDTDGELVPRTEWPLFVAVRSGIAVLDEVVTLDFGTMRKHVAVDVVPVPLAGGKVMTFVASLSDVTSQMKARERRRELLSVTSHELRSPLTPLIGFLQMLRKQAERGEDVDPSLLQRAENQVGRLARLIETMLDLSRIESGTVELDIETRDLRDLIYSVVDIWSAHPRGVIIEAGLPGAPVLVPIDADRIEQVVTNLVDNAVKHSESGQRVTLTVMEAVDSVTIELSDEGVGIDEEVMPRIFDRFFTHGNEVGVGGGIGLGLYVSREIVECHGGEIEVESTVGVGTTIRIVLPRDSH